MCDDSNVCGAFLFLCWLVVGALLGVWDDTRVVVVPVVQVAACCGWAAVWWFVLWCVGVV